MASGTKLGCGEALGLKSGTEQDGGKKEGAVGCRSLEY